MQSLVEQKRASAAYADTDGKSIRSSWKYTLVAPSECPTGEITSAQASSADVIPAVVAVTQLLGRRSDSDSSAQTAKITLLEAVSDHFNGVRHKALYFTATMLNACYKDQYFNRDIKRREHLICWMLSWNRHPHARQCQKLITVRIKIFYLYSIFHTKNAAQSALQ